MREVITNDCALLYSNQGPERANLREQNRMVAHLKENIPRQAALRYG